MENEENQPVTEPTPALPQDPVVTGSSPLPVRIPTALLLLIDRECSERGITRSELVKHIVTNYYQQPGAAPTAAVTLVLNQQKEHITQLERQLQALTRELQTKQPEQDAPEKATQRDSDYVAELENDLLTAVQIATKSILPTRTDFRRRTKHYGRLEAKFS